MFKARKATRDERILALETRCRVTEEAHEAFKKDMHGLLLELSDLLEGQQKKIEALEAKVQELEAGRAPVISDLTKGGGEKPMTATKLIDLWVNGKDGDGK